MKSLTRITIGIFVFFCFAVNTFSQSTCRLHSDLPPHKYNLKSQLRSNADIFEIPIVFHVVGKEGLLGNMPDEKLHDLVERVNTYFLGKNEDLINIRSEFESVVGISNIQFSIKEIIKIRTDKKFESHFFGPDDTLEHAKSTDKGGSDPLDIERHLNIWIINVLQPDGTNNTFIGGYATPPEDMPGWPEFGWTQGILIDDAIVNDNSKAKVLVHEIGHFLGLRHLVEIFNSSCQDNDGIDDTPRCLTSPKCVYVDTCPNDKPDMVENFMNPVHQVCRTTFTKGQVSFMRNTLQEFRPNLYSVSNNSVPETLPGITVFPTVALQELNIGFTDYDFKIVEYEIYTSNGNQLVKDRFLATSRKSIDVSNIPNGLNYIQITYADKVVIKKFIKA